MQARLSSTVVLAILLLNTYFVTAQQPLNFRKYQEEDGLSNGFVTSIFQDSQGFLWLGTANGVNRFDGYTFKSFYADELDSTSLSHPTTWNMAEDGEGYLWFGTLEGLNRYDRATETFKQYFPEPDNPLSLSSEFVVSTTADKNGDIWIGTAKGVNRKKKGKDQFERYLYLRDTFRIVRSMLLAQDSSFWISAWDTLYQFDYEEETLLAYPIPAADPEINQIRILYEDAENYLWVGTQYNGAFRFDPKTGDFTEHLVHDPKNQNTLSHNTVAAFAEKEKQLWIGTSGGGLSIWDPISRTTSRHTVNNSPPSGVNSETIRSMLKDQHGNLWLGSFYDGLYQYEANWQPFFNFDQSTGLPSKKINSVESDSEGKVWIAFADAGIGVFDNATKSFEAFYRHDPNDPNSLPGSNVKDIFIDENDRVWLGIANVGVAYLDQDNGRFVTVFDQRIGQVSQFLNWISKVYPEENGDVWIGTHNGLCKYIRKDHVLQAFPFPAGDVSGARHEINTYVTDIWRDQFDQLWFSTYGGLNLYRAETDSFIFYPHQDQVLHIARSNNDTIWLGTTTGLAWFDRDSESILGPNYQETYEKAILAPIEDDQGRLWYGIGNDGLQVLDRTEGTVLSYNKKGGLVGNHLWASTKTADGTLYFAGTEGLVVFHPDSLNIERIIPRVALTDFKLFNKSIPIRGTIRDTSEIPSALEQSITVSKELVLKHWQNYFSLEFSALDFTVPENNHYRYQLVGYDKDWVNSNAGRRLITYTNLDPGRYTFRVQGATANGIWDERAEATLSIRILAPWWETWWAYLLYIALLLSVIITIYRFQLNQKLAQSEAARLKDLDIEKNRLFANVSHEFRTPLTVILGMAGKMKEDPKKWFEEGVESIQRNGQRVLHLVNQMLDLSRLEFGKMQLEMQQGDIIPFLSYLIQSYESFAEAKGIKLIVDKQINSQLMDFSPDAITKITNNLLSNAFKYTSEDGTVTVRFALDANQLLIEIRDTGQGIAEEYLPHIFDRFYQVDATSTRATEGTGIGLALVKELVDRLEGQISVQSVKQIGTTFQVLLPIKQEAQAMLEIDDFGIPVPTPQISARAGTSSLPASNGHLPLVLIIEDNEDVAAYISSCLVGRYQVHLAINGRIGVAMALEMVPDLIICDVMMPEMDGYEVCKKLKQEERSSHIPIVMLTAKVDTDSRLQGLRQGADAYLGKPFNPEELELRLANLLQLRKQIQAYFEQFPSKSVPQHSYPKEQEFLKRIKSIVLEHLADEDFGIPELCKAMGISRSQLHRKLKALTGKPTSLIVRSIRLEQARDLLLRRELSIAEIAYQVGFANPNYFSTVFSDFYGLSPTEMRDKLSLHEDTSKQQT
ncbi:MAG: response regulator [Saprospiraceae bacterium]|nr:response regulator [Saprospiraceae bacterium]